MNDFIHDGPSIQFWKVSGEVISTQKRSETQVWSSGGGGYVSKGTGYVSSPTVKSTVITQHEFWLKTEDGPEIPVKFSGVDIPMCEGQRVTLISAKKSDKDTSLYSILVNHAAERHWFINNAASLNKEFKFSKQAVPQIFSDWSLWLPVGILFMLALSNGFTGIAFIIACIYLPLFFLSIKGKSKVKEVERKLDAHLEQLAQLTHQNP